MPNFNRNIPAGASHIAVALLSAVLAASLVAAGPAAAREVGSRLGISAATSTTTVPVQVRLASSSGTPINGLKTMTFKLYNVASGGSALWSETWTEGNAVQVTDGVASVLLGSQTSLPQSLIATNGTLYLGITVDAEAEMQPRVQLGSAPIAMSVPDGAITTAKIEDGAVSLAKLAPAVQDSLGVNFYRNALINGNMDVWQRGTSILSPTNKFNAYAADRWYVGRSGYAPGLVASQQDGTGVPGSRFSLRVQRPAGNSGLQANYVMQGIETANAVLMRGRKWTLSFWARKGVDYSATSSVLQFGVSERTAIDESPEAYGGVDGLVSINLTTSWQKYTMTMSSAVQISTNTIKVVFVASPQGTAGANDWFEITQVQLNAGETAAPFVPSFIADELAACQRYYYGIEFATGWTSPIGAGYNFSEILALIQVPFPVRMRSAPVLLYSGIFRTVGVEGTHIDAISLQANQTNYTGMLVQVNTGNVLIPGRGTSLFGVSITNTASIGFDAEP